MSEGTHQFRGRAATLPDGRLCEPVVCCACHRRSDRALLDGWTYCRQVRYVGTGAQERQIATGGWSCPACAGRASRQGQP
jgi:hypothetical protein